VVILAAHLVWTTLWNDRGTKAVLHRSHLPLPWMLFICPSTSRPFQQARPLVVALERAFLAGLACATDHGDHCQLEVARRMSTKQPGKMQLILTNQCSSAHPSRRLRTRRWRRANSCWNNSPHWICLHLQHWKRRCRQRLAICPPHQSEFHLQGRQYLCQASVRAKIPSRCQ